jgi:hypothetical protein
MSMAFAFGLDDHCNFPTVAKDMTLSTTPLSAPCNFEPHATEKEEGFVVNQHLMKQLEGMIGDALLAPESNGRPKIFEGLLWSILGAAVWVLILYLF